MRIVIDTREQNPLTFSHDETISACLPTGDYSLEGYEHRIAVERKSPQDLFATLGGGHGRFRRELARARGYDYFAILIEAPFAHVRDKRFPDSYRTAMRGDVIIQTCMTLKLKHGVDVIFAQDRREAASILHHIFKAYYKTKYAAMFSLPVSKISIPFCQDCATPSEECVCKGVLQPEG